MAFMDPNHLLVDGFGGLYAAAMCLCMAWCQQRRSYRLTQRPPGGSHGHDIQRVGSIRSDGLSLKEPDLQFPLLMEEEKLEEDDAVDGAFAKLAADRQAGERAVAEGNRDDGGEAEVVPTRGSTAIHMALVFLMYACGVLELIAGVGLKEESLAMSASRGAGWIVLGLTCEVEHHILPPPPYHTGWRVRAALRLCTALCLAWLRAAVYLGWDPEWLDFEHGDEELASHSWGQLVLLGVHALVLIGLAAVVVSGPPPLMLVPRPAPVQLRAFLLFKLLYLHYWKIIIGFVRTANLADADESAEALGLSDLPNMMPVHTAAECWKVGQDCKEGTSLFFRLATICQFELVPQVCWTLWSLCCVYAAPFGMLGLIDYIGEFEGGSVSGHAVFYGALVALGPLCGSVGDAHTFNNGWQMGVKARAYLTHAVSVKALSFDQSASSHSTGELTNLLAVDADSICTFMPMASWLWLEGAQLIVTLVILYYILGVSALGGLGVCLLAFPVNTVVMRYQKRLQERLMKEKDERMAVVTEVINSIRAIKLHGWEPMFEQQIAEKRNKEIVTLKTFSQLGAVTSTLWLCAPTMAALASFLIKSQVMGETLTPAQGFTSLTLFQLLSVSLTFLPYVINQAIQANVGLQRIQKFLDQDDVQGRSRPNHHQNHNHSNGDDGAARVGACQLNDATFQWSKAPKPDEEEMGAKGDDGKQDGGGKKGKASKKHDDDDATTAILGELDGGDDGPLGTLEHVSVVVPPGQLSIVVGPTGCGKSSLLAGLLGDIKRLSGGSVVNGKVSYCPQKAWVVNDTLKNNIIFGAPYDESRYQEVLKVCALLPDLKSLEAGDRTEIGERGVNLSGGQQQRVNLARACYAFTEIVLLDDVLSAVDAQTGDHIYQHCILGFLRNRTRVLVTHSVALTLPKADHVVVMEQGRVVATGRPDSDAPEIIRLRKRSLSSNDLAAMAHASIGSDPGSKASNGQEGPSPPGLQRAGSSQASAASNPEGASDTVTGREKDPDAGADAARGTITGKEERARGAAKTGTYLSYLKAAGGLKFNGFFFLICLTYSTLSPVQSVALKNWMDKMEEEGGGAATLTYCAYYSAAASGFILVCLFRNLLLPYGTVAASRTLHSDMTHTVLRAKVGWFESTPLGRILNRFSSDIRAIDMDVGNQFKDAVVIFLNTCFIAAVCVLGTGEVAAQLTVLTAVILTLVACSRVFKLYRIAAREQKRLESVTKSPLFAFFAEMVSGASVVRAYQHEARFLETMDSRVDDANRSLYYLWFTNQWLRVSMNTVGSLVTASVVAAVLWQGGSLSDGSAGLTLSYATQFTQAVMWMFRIQTQLEVSMNDVERVNEFSNLEKEAEGGNPPSPSWPAHGEIEFRNLQMKYPSATTPVFDDLSFKVPPRKRVGVVGRTGAGKSSLAVALFRVVEPSAGTIMIDGEDYRQIELRELRRRVSIIQQEPTVFRGTVRYNLSPVDDVEDHLLWDALRRTSDSLHAKVSSLGGLDAEITEGGANLSAGERQLLCMARSLLRKPSIWLMDEATASIDHETDVQIQAMVKRDFKDNTTVLTVAHRLHTIAFYDLVLVLDKGKVVEYDAPLKLLLTEGSAFRQLAEESGDYHHLLAIARGEEADEAHMEEEEKGERVVMG